MEAWRAHARWKDAKRYSHVAAGSPSDTIRESVEALAHVAAWHLRCHGIQSSLSRFIHHALSTTKVRAHHHIHTHFPIQVWQQHHGTDEHPYLHRRLFLCNAQRN